MRILGIETSGPQAGIALLGDDQIVASGELRVRGRTGEKLTHLVDELLRLVEWELHGLHRVAVDVGPGSFTGLRVGLALAKGLSLGTGLPVVPVSSLEALALDAPGDGPVVASLPAPRGMVYAAVFARGPLGLRCILEEGCWRPSDLWDAVEGTGLHPRGGRLNVLGPAAETLVGTRWARCDFILSPDLRPRSPQVARLAAGPGSGILAGDELAALVPRYIRGADVRKPKTGSPTQTTP